MTLALLAWGSFSPHQLVLGDLQHPSTVSAGGKEGFDALKSQSAFKAMKMRRFDRITQLSIYLLELTLKNSSGLLDNIQRSHLNLVVSTGLGTLETSLSCLDQIFDNGDKYCSPMAFMNSVHNSMGANLAQMFDLQGQNMTFAQTQNSFDLALIHASMLLQEHPQALVLVAGIEEMDQALNRILDQANSAGDCYRGLEGDRCTFMLLGQSLPSPFQIELEKHNRPLEPMAGSRDHHLVESKARGDHPLASAQDIIDQLLDLEAGRVPQVHFSNRILGQR